MIINHNMNAMNAHRNMTANTTAAGKSMEKLSSGLRINRAGDDAAGLSISEKMRGQIRGLDQATRNSQDGISMIQTAEGGLNEVHSILQRMRELAVQGSNDTNVTADRAAINTEMGELANEISRISTTTAFNGKQLLNGGAGNNCTFQVGANEKEVMVCDFTTAGIDVANNVSTTIGTSAAMSIKVDTTADAQAAITTIDTQIELTSTGRSTLGAWQNRLEHTINNLSNSSENLQAAESRIRDVDMAKEMMSYSKTNILTQAAQAMISQANQTPQGVLQLLR